MHRALAGGTSRWLAWTGKLKLALKAARSVAIGGKLLFRQPIVGGSPTIAWCAHQWSGIRSSTPAAASGSI